MIEVAVRVFPISYEDPAGSSFVETSRPSQADPDTFSSSSFSPPVSHDSFPDDTFSWRAKLSKSCESDRVFYGANLMHECKIHLISHSIRQSINQSINQSNQIKPNQIKSKSIQSINQSNPFNQSFNQSVSQSLNQSVNQSINQSKQPQTCAELDKSFLQSI